MCKQPNKFRILLTKRILMNTGENRKNTMFPLALQWSADYIPAGFYIRLELISYECEAGQSRTGLQKLYLQPTIYQKYFQLREENATEASCYNFSPKSFSSRCPANLIRHFVPVFQVSTWMRIFLFNYANAMHGSDPHQLMSLPFSSSV